MFAKYPLIKDKTGNMVYSFLTGITLHKNRFEYSMKERAYLWTPQTNVIIFVKNTLFTSIKITTYIFL